MDLGNLKSFKTLLISLIAPCEYRGMFLFLWIENKTPVLWGQQGVLCERVPVRPPCVPASAVWPHDSPVGSSWASKVQTGIWEQLVDKWLRLKRSFSCLLQRQEQMFPIKL